MKRLFFAALVVMATMSYTASAQFKIDKEGIEKKIAKAEADCQNEKKAVKGSTWISRAEAYYEGATAATSGLYVGMDIAAAKLMYGSNMTPETVEVVGTQYDKYSLQYFDAYFSGGKLVFWESKMTIGGDNVMEVAIESYGIAAEKDAKSASDAQKGLIEISDHYKSLAGNFYQAGKYKEAANEFVNSYNVCAKPALGVVDTLSIYNAGFLYAAEEEYELAISALEEAANKGYLGENGESYFLRGVSLIGLEKYDDAKALLIEGITNYPSNNKIVEGLMSLYTTTGEDASEVIPYIEKAIESDPNNYVFYDGLGRIYDKLGDNDKCLEAFKKAAEIAPNEFNTQFNLGMLYIRKANSMYDVIREIPNASQEDYANALAQQIEYFKSSIEPLEKALSFRETSKETVEALKNVTFRLREEDGIMDKYNKYNEMFKAM